MLHVMFQVRKGKSASKEVGEVGKNMLVICHLPQDTEEGTLDKIRPSPVVVFYAASIPFVSISAKMEHETMACTAFCWGVLCSEAFKTALEHNTMPWDRLRSSALCSNLAVMERRSLSPLRKNK